MERKEKQKARKCGSKSRIRKDSYEKIKESKKEKRKENVGKISEMIKTENSDQKILFIISMFSFSANIKRKKNQ